MRTNIEIDDNLMRRAMIASHAPTKKAVVEEALQLLVQIKGQSAIRELRGKVAWRSHDDDWFASDEEILKRGRMGEGEKAACEPASGPELVDGTSPR